MRGVAGDLEPPVSRRWASVVVVTTTGGRGRPRVSLGPDRTDDVVGLTLRVVAEITRSPGCSSASCRTAAEGRSPSGNCRVAGLAEPGGAGDVSRAGHRLGRAHALDHDLLETQRRDRQSPRERQELAVGSGPFPGRDLRCRGPRSRCLGVVPSVDALITIVDQRAHHVEGNGHRDHEDRHSRGRNATSRRPSIVEVDRPPSTSGTTSAVDAGATSGSGPSPRRSALPVRRVTVIRPVAVPTPAQPTTKLCQRLAWRTSRRQ